jgi:hypothetical protein
MTQGSVYAERLAIPCRNVYSELDLFGHWRDIYSRAKVALELSAYNVNSEHHQPSVASTPLIDEKRLLLCD